MERRMLEERVGAEWIDYPTAERYSGLSHTTLWRYVTTGRLKAARVGRSVRIHLPSLREFMEAASEATIEEKSGPSRQWSGSVREDQEVTM
jgi:excisionase family DNA binding protein